MTTKFVFLPLLLALAGAAAADESTDASADIVETLGPGKVHEACFILAAGDLVNYSFHSDYELSFNIHYHLDDDILFPVEEHSTIAEDASFTADVDQHYCLMWTNHRDGQTDVSYSYKIN